MTFITSHDPRSLQANQRKELPLFHVFLTHGPYVSWRGIGDTHLSPTMAKSTKVWTIGGAVAIVVLTVLLLNGILLDRGRWERFGDLRGISGDRGSWRGGKFIHDSPVPGEQGTSSLQGRSPANWTSCRHLP